MQYLSSLPFALALSLVGCSDEDRPTLTADDFTAPTTAAEIDDLYERLDTCNDSFITRTLAPRPELVSTSLWTAPATDRAGLVAWRDRAGWSTLLLANELAFTNVADDVRSPDAACSAVHRLLSPASGATARSQFTHLLLYLDEAEHPYTAYPEAGIETKLAPAAASLAGYVNVIFAERDVSPGGDVSYRDVREQHLPLFLSCERPFAIETTVAMFDSTQLAQVDPSMCDAGTDLDNDGDLDHRCVAERGRHAEENACTFLVDASSLTTLDGAQGSVIFGGTLATRGAGADLEYSMTVDRFSRATR